MVWARRVSRSSPPAQGFAPAASPHTPGGCLQILANAGAAKNGPMPDFVWIRGGLIGVLLDTEISFAEFVDIMALLSGMHETWG